MGPRGHTGHVGSQAHATTNTYCFSLFQCNGPAIMNIDFFSSFLSSIKTTILYPIKNVFDVTVRAQGEMSTLLELLPTACCPECKALLQSSGIVDAIGAVNWNAIAI